MVVVTRAATGIPMCDYVFAPNRVQRRRLARSWCCTGRTDNRADLRPVARARLHRPAQSAKHVMAVIARVAAVHASICGIVHMATLWH
jgi:hypothetical protein